MSSLVVVLGIDPDGRPHASSFPFSRLAIAQRAAATMRFAAVLIDDPALVDLAVRLPMGKSVEPGFGYSSPVDQEIYDALAALVGTPAQIGGPGPEQ